MRNRTTKKKGDLKGGNDHFPWEESEQQTPAFSFEYLQHGWCIQDCQRDERAKMLDRLRVLGKLTWRQIRQEDRHRYGTEIINRNALKTTVPSFITPDTKLIAFRAYDLVAMVGYKSDRVFHVLWIDRTRKLYDHG